MTHVKQFKSGAAKDFEVVQKLRNVIVLEDNGLEYHWEDDEWEHIYDEEFVEEQRSYSSVLRGNETWQHIQRTNSILFHSRFQRLNDRTEHKAFNAFDLYYLFTGCACLGWHM